MGGLEPSTFRSESENTNPYAMQAAHNKRVVYDKKCNTFWCDSIYYEVWKHETPSENADRL